MDNSMEGRPPMRPAVRANSSPVSTVVHGMRPKLPPRSVDDSIPRRFPRDSDLFSPVVRTGASSHVSRTPDDALVRRDLTHDYGPELDQVGVPAVWDRRTSDIIPTAPVKQTSSDSLDFSNDLDVQTVVDTNDDSLFSPHPKDEGNNFTPTSNPGYISERRGNGISRTASREPQPSVGASIGEKKVSIPRGMAFSRLRKSASEMTPRTAALPPRPPRSSTHPRSTKKDVPSEGDSKNIPPSEEVNSFDGDGFVTPRAESKEDYDSAVRPGTRRVRTELASPSLHVGEASVPALERKISTPGPSSHDSQPLVETIRQTIVAEIDAVRQDLRGDLLNIHTELVLTSSRQTREIQQMFSERDKLIKSLLHDMAELRKENAELRAFIADE